MRSFVTTGLLAAVAVLGAAAPAPAQTYSPGVEDLRDALRLRTGRERDQLVPKRLTALRSLSDMRQALLLRDWRPDDEKYRKELGNRLRQALESAVNRGSATTRRAAAEFIGEIEAQLRNREVEDRSLFLPDLAPLLFKLFRDPDPAVRLAAIRALGRLSETPDLTVPAQEKVFERGSLAERRAAANALFQLASASSPASRPGARGRAAVGGGTRALILLVVPAAGQGLKNSDAEVRRLCLHAMLRSARALLIPDPLKRVDYTPEAVAGGRRELAALLPYLTKLAQQGPELARHLQDPDPEVRLLARRVLEELANLRWRYLRREASLNAAATIRAPEEQLPPPPEGRLRTRARPDGLRRTSATAQAQPAPRGRDDADEDPLRAGLMPAVDVLKGGLTGRDPSERLVALDFLELVGPDAASAAPAIIRALRDPNRFVRWAAARALRKTGPFDRKTADAAIPGLSCLLVDPDIDLRLAAVAALARFGPAAVNAVPALIRVTKAGDAEVRIAAMGALTSIGLRAMGGRAEDVITALADALGNPEAPVRAAAAETLGKFGRGSRAAIPALRRALGDENPEVRRAASEALLDIAAD